MNLSKTIILLLQIFCVATTTCSAKSLRGLNEDNRVINGEEAIDGRYSYAVSIQDSIGGRHFCGGSLIAPNIVLSAAHCIQNEIEVKVVIGRHDLRDTTDGEEIIVKEQIPHPAYNASTTDNDYMLMILESDTTEDVNFIKIHPDYIGGGQSVNTMGWGETDPRDQVKYPAPILMHTDVDTLTHEECKASAGSVGGTESHGWNIGGFDATYEEMITPNMICATDSTNGEDSCFGDSGGPLVILSETGDDLQVAVVSWGFGCAHPSFPGVYARISAQYDWVKDSVCKASSTPPSSFGCDPSYTVSTAVLSTDESSGSDEDWSTIYNGVPLVISEEEEEWTTIYTEDFSSPFGLFYQTDGSNTITPYQGAYGRVGVVHVHGGENGYSQMKSNLITMDNNPFTIRKVTFSFLPIDLEEDELCLVYRMNGGAINGKKCWSGAIFDNEVWHDDVSLEFDLSPSTTDLRLHFHIMGDDNKDEVVIDSVTIQGKKTVQ